MGILTDAKPVLIVCTRDLARATAFYRDTLGLTKTSEDAYAAIFDVGGNTMRVSTVADFKPHEHTVLGFKVPDVATAVKGLRRNGVNINTYPGYKHDELGIVTVPGTSIQVAWFTDPDGNVLSVTSG